MLHNGWTESQLREGLRLATPATQDILRYIATNPRCTSAEIADELGLRSERSVGPRLKSLTDAGAHLGINSPDGQFRWPLEWPGKRGNS